MLAAHEILSFLTLGYLPVRVLYFHSIGIETPQIFVFEAITAMTNLATDLPLGALTDRLGRRVSVLAGHLLSLGFFAGLLVCKRTEALYLLMAVQGLSHSFISGSKDSLFYESILQLGGERYFELIGKIQFYSAVFPVFILCGALGQVDLRIPICLSALCSVALVGVALGLRETGQQFREGGGRPLGLSLGALRADIFGAVRKLLGSPDVRVLFAAFFLVDTMRQPIFLLAQTRMSELGFTALQLGLLQNTWNYVGLGFALKMHLFVRRWGSFRTVGHFVLALAVSCFLLGALPGGWAMAFIIPVGACMRVILPVLNKRINEFVADSERASVGSCMSTVLSLGVIAIQSASSQVLKHVDSSLFFVVLAALLSAGFLWLRPRLKVAFRNDPARRP